MFSGYAGPGQQEKSPGLGRAVISLAFNCKGRVKRYGRVERPIQWALYCGSIRL